MSVTAPDIRAHPEHAAQLQDAASALAVAAAGADALARVLLLASVAPHLVDLGDLDPHELDWLCAGTERLRVALDLFATGAGPEIADGLRERLNLAEGKARHDRRQAVRAAAASSSAP